MGTATPRSAIMSSRSLQLMPYRQYRRTHSRMISAGNRRRLNTDIEEETLQKPVS